MRLMTTATLDIINTEKQLKSEKKVSPKRKRLKGTDVGIPVRKMGLNYDELPQLWFANNGLLSAIFSGFSAALPEGEDQFMYSVRLYQDKITDPILKAQVRAFIGQEAHHSREHEAFNEAIIRSGFPVQRVENFVRGMNKMMRKYQSPADQLAGTVCGEHFTALLANYILTNPDILNTFEEPARSTWAWHAIEELEHKGVAFDVYDQLVGDRKRLHRAMKRILPMFILINVINAMSMMHHTRQMTNLKEWKKAFNMLGKLWKSSKSDYKDFFKSNFHPWDHDCRQTLADAREKHLGEIKKQAA